jgi:DNA-binding transcriptional LysR family regulator
MAGSHVLAKKWHRNYCAGRDDSRETVLQVEQQTDLNDIAIFGRVAETASFSAAARMLGMPRATVSRVVARLERAIGTQLLYRTTRRVELTELGREYYATTARGLALIGEAGEAVAAARAEPSGLLRVSAPINFATMNLISWVSEFLRTYEKVRMSLWLTDTAVDPIDGGVDVAILTGRQPSSTYLSRLLGSTSLILVASPEYLARRPAPASIDAASEHDFILFSSDRGSETWSLDGPDGPLEVQVTGRINVTGPHAELLAALSGLGIALLPSVVVAPYLASGELVCVLPDYGREGGMISAVFPANRHQPTALREFLEFLVARGAGLGGKGDGFRLTKGGR